jgi:hypothetical protein
MAISRSVSPFALKPSGIGETLDGSTPALVSTTLDALNEYVDMIGQIVWDSYAGSKTVSSAGGAVVFRTGTITTWTTATLTISIQDVDTTTGPPPRGDGGADVSTTFIAGTDALASNTVYNKAFTSGTKSITSGQLCAIRFQLTAFTTANIQIAAKNGARSTFPCVVNAIPTAAIAGAIPNVMIIADDGTVGWFMNSGFVNTWTTRDIDVTAANPDEYGNVFTLPFAAEIVGMQHLYRAAVATGATGVGFYLYTDMATPSLQESYVLDPNHWVGASAALGYYVHTILFDTPITIAANTEFALTVRPLDTSSDLAFIEWSYDSYANAKKALLSPYTDIQKVTREGATGALTKADSIILPVWPVLSGLDYSAGGGGGSANLVRGKL